LNDQDSTPSEGYYWPGKDYANSYKADFKDLHDFSSGFNKKFLINTQVSLLILNEFNILRPIQ
jgi:hypothetical protein